MARVTVEDCMKRVNNRFCSCTSLPNGDQLRKGAKPLVDAPKNKEVVQALREIAAGHVPSRRCLTSSRINFPVRRAGGCGMTDTESALQELTVPADLEADIDALAEEISIGDPGSSMRTPSTEETPCGGRDLHLVPPLG